MKKRSLAILALSLSSLLSNAVALYAAPKPAAKSDSKTIKVTLVKQVNNYFGSTELYMSDNAICMKGREGSTILVAKAPQWKVVMVNKVSNSGIEFPLDYWAAHGILTVKSKVNLLSGTPSSSYDPQLKLDCWEKTFKTGGRYYGSDDPMIFRSLSKQTLSQVKYKYTRNMPINSNIGKFIKGLYSTPQDDSLPLELVNKFTDGSQTYMYRTLEIKPSSVPEETFNYPQNFKKVKSLEDMVMASLDKKKVNDLIDGLIDEEKHVKDKEDK